jgi:hypothetical protein
MGRASGDSPVTRSGGWLGLGLGLGGMGLLGLSAVTISTFVDAAARGVPIIAWDTGGWIALPVALALLALTAALYIGRHDGQRVEGPRSDAIKRLLILAVALLPCAILLPFSAHWLAGRHLEARGYTACGDAFWIAPDRLPDRAAAQARCEEWRRG